MVAEVFIAERLYLGAQRVLQVDGNVQCQVDEAESVIGLTPG